ncbi:MAG: hypothetical protein R2828_35100 [Saprospiraceae bacterium]
MSIVDRILALFRVARQETPRDPKPQPVKKHITTMVNSITVSSDMSTLYLIDNGRSIDFPFNNPRGILIGSLKGQLSVATAIDPPTADETAGSKTIKLPTEGAQWTMFYHIDNGVLGIIGASDIDIAISQPGGPNCNQNFFDLTTNVVRIRRIGNAIEISSRPV